jgi:hypothetical protein
MPRSTKANQKGGMQQRRGKPQKLTNCCRVHWQLQSMHGTSIGSLGMRALPVMRDVLVRMWLLPPAKVLNCNSYGTSSLACSGGTVYDGEPKAAFTAALLRMMRCLNLKDVYPVVCLTDLCDDWMFLWVHNGTLLLMDPCSRGRAVAFCRYVVSEGGVPKNCPGLPELPEGHVPDDRVQRDGALGPEEADDLASSEDDRITDFEGVVSDDELANLIWAQRIMKARAMVAAWGLKHPEPEDLTPFI